MGDFSFEDFSLYKVGIAYICLLFALCVHEAAHAWVADRCGDPSPREMGRVTLNPIPHIDPIGTVLMPLIMMVSNAWFLLGWAKPVQYNPINLRNMRRDSVLIALAGPGSNLLLAVGGMVGLRIAVMALGLEPVLKGPAGDLLKQLMLINLVLMLFNMIPLPPLDGHRLLDYFLPESAQRMLESVAPFGLIIAVILVANTGFLSVPLQALMNGMTLVALWGVV